MSDKQDDVNIELDEEFGDLFNDSKVEPTPAPQSNPAPTPAPVVKPTPAPVNSASANSAPTNDGFIQFGQKVSSLAIPRFKATKDVKSRIAVISKNILAIKTHYVEGLGTIRCFEGKCCELEGLPRVKYILPVVQYEVNKAGVPISDSLELKGLVLGSEQYDALATAVQYSGRDLTDTDIIVSCTDDQYQKITFAADPSKGAIWKTYAESAKAIAALYKANKDKLYMCVARSVSPETYLSHKGFVGNTPAAASVNSLDDLGLDD